MVAAITFLWFRILIMLRGGSGGCTSAKWRARCMCLILILEFLQFSIGSAIPSTKGYGAQVAPPDDSSIAVTRLRSYSNYCPASLLEVHFIPKGHLFPDVIPKSQSYFSITGTFQNLVRRFIAAAVATHQIQFGIEASINSLPAEASHDNDHRQLPLHLRDDGTHAVTSSTRTNRRLLLRGPARRNRRSSSPRYFWALNQQQRQQQRQGRRAMEEASRSPAGQQTQQVLLGPPAPPGLVHNEKQDWNQDYAEPDVHPPSSN